MSQAIRPQMSLLRPHPPMTCQMHQILRLHPDSDTGFYISQVDGVTFETVPKGPFSEGESVEVVATRICWLFLHQLDWGFHL